MESEILIQALRLWFRGLAVFPVDTKTKTPLVTGYHGLTAARATEAQVREWFGGGDRAIGVACGPISDLFLLDLDFKHSEASEFFEKNRYRIPRTWEEKTASGGRHFYFRWCEALNTRQTNTTSKLWRGVDTKGHGGYSKITPSSGYRWIVAPHMARLVECPQWLIDMLPAKDSHVIADRERKPEDWMLDELDHIDPKDPVNGRTPTFVRAINRLKAKGLTVRETTDYLMKYAERYDYGRLPALVTDQYNRYPPKIDTAPTDLNETSFKSFMADAKQVPYLVPPLIAYNTINIIAGLPESRKSWLLVDLAIALASGTKWLNRYQCSPCKVLFFDQERGKSEMQRRFQALLQGRRLSADRLEGNLIPKAGTHFQINLDNSFDTLRTILGSIRPDVLLIDSLKAFQSGDIKQDQDMQRVFERFKQLRQDYGLTIVILHHENKGAYQSMREAEKVTPEKVAGSGVINEVPEEIFIVRTFEAESSIVHHAKNNCGLKVPPFTMRVRDLKPDRSEIVVEAV